MNANGRPLTCPSCGYELTGHEGDSVRCSECDRDWPRDTLVTHASSLNFRTSPQSMAIWAGLGISNLFIVWLSIVINAGLLALLATFFAGCTLGAFATRKSDAVNSLLAFCAPAVIAGLVAAVIPPVTPEPLLYAVGVLVWTAIGAKVGELLRPRRPL